MIARFALEKGGDLSLTLRGSFWLTAAGPMCSYRSLNDVEAGRRAQPKTADIGLEGEVPPPPAHRHSMKFYSESSGLLQMLHRSF